MNYRNAENSSNSFEIADYLTAREVYAAWQAEESKELDDWLMRQRKAELNALVRKVIKNEFSKEDKRLIELRWYKGYNCNEIGKMLGMSRSAVYRRLDKINDVLFDKLKYALEYRFGKKNEKSALLVEKDVRHYGNYESMFPVGYRLHTLRTAQQLSLSDVCEKTGIPQKRLTVIEKHGADISACELKKMAEFYKVSSDYILFGKKRILRDPFTGMPIGCNC